MVIQLPLQKTTATTFTNETVSKIASYFGFDGRMCVLIVLIPDHCVFI